VNQKDANRPGLRKLRVTREYQPTNRRVNNFTRRRRFTSCRLSVDATSKKKSEKKYFRLLTFCQPYQRKRSANRRYEPSACHRNAVAGFAAAE